MSMRPIANKYCEGKLKRTLKREFKSMWNCIDYKWMGPHYLIHFAVFCVKLLVNNCYICYNLTDKCKSYLTYEYTIIKLFSSKLFYSNNLTSHVILTKWYKISIQIIPQFCSSLPVSTHLCSIYLLQNFYSIHNNVCLLKFLELQCQINITIQLCTMTFYSKACVQNPLF